MDFNPVILAIPLYFILIVVEVIVNFYKKAKRYRLNDALTNISCGISSQVVNSLWGVIAVAMYQYVYEHFAVLEMPSTWWAYLILFVLVDFCYYWFHRASHEIHFLWSTSHIVHHQSEEYNLSVALRQSSFGGIFSMLFYLPLALLGFNAYLFLFAKGLNLIYQFWIHTEFIKKLPAWFEYLFNTPSHHRVHHGRNPKYIDRNHAGTFMIWDRMFGTFQKEEESPTYGVTTPTKSWNPIWANIQPMHQLSKQFIRTEGWKDKLKVLFYKPGWQPQSLGGYQSTPTIAKQETVKYDAKPHAIPFQYIFIQYALSLGYTAFFLFTSSAMTELYKWISGIIILISVGILGVLMERKKFWFRVESIRLLLVTSAWYLSLDIVGLGIGLGTAMLSVVWLFPVQKKFQ